MRQPFQMSRQGRVKRVFCPVLRFSAFYQVQLASLDETTTVAHLPGWSAATREAAAPDIVSLLVI